MPNKILREQEGMESIRSHGSRLARKLYFKSQLSDNSQIRQLGQYTPMHNKTKWPRPVGTLISMWGEPL
jgi:hypothetical protein